MSNARNLANLLGTGTQITTADIADGAFQANKNLIINGSLQVWQRGTSGFGHNVFSADRWREDYNTGNGLSVSKYEIPSGGEAGLPTPITSALKMAYTVGSGAGSGLNDLRQKIEFPKQFDGQTLTLSYYVKASSACQVNNRRISAINATNAYSGASLPAVNVTTEWQRVVDTFTFGTSSNGVYPSNSCLDVVLSAPVCTTVDIDYYVTGVQLELGDTATPFEHRSYGDELARCQRYFEKIGGNSTYDPIGQGSQRTTGQTYFHVYFKQTKRAAPTVSFTNNVIVTDRLNFDQVVSSIGTNEPSVFGFHGEFQHSAVGAIYRPLFVCSGPNSPFGYMTFDSEL